MCGVYLTGDVYQIRGVYFRDDVYQIDHLQYFCLGQDRASGKNKFRSVRREAQSQRVSRLETLYIKKENLRLLLTQRLEILSQKTPGGIIGGPVAHPAPSAIPVVVFVAKCTLCQSSYSAWITGYGAQNYDVVIMFCFHPNTSSW